MSHTETGKTAGGRQTSLELNLVPFIDLMSVLITFLLITAVWSQVSMIQIGSSLYGKKTPTDPAQVTEDMNVILKLEVKEDGYVLTMGTKRYSIPHVQGDFDDLTLIAQLEGFKTEHPNKKDAIIFMADALPYERLIRTMDQLLKVGFPSISVGTGAPN